MMEGSEKKQRNIFMQKKEANTQGISGLPHSVSNDFWTELKKDSEIERQKSGISAGTSEDGGFAQYSMESPQLQGNIKISDMLQKESSLKANRGHNMVSKIVEEKDQRVKAVREFNL